MTKKKKIIFIFLAIAVVVITAVHGPRVYLADTMERLNVEYRNTSGKLLYTDGPKAGVPWSIPIFPCVLLLQSWEGVGPLSQRGGVRVVFYIGFKTLSVNTPFSYHTASIEDFDRFATNLKKNRKKEVLGHPPIDFFTYAQTMSRDAILQYLGAPDEEEPGRFTYTWKSSETYLCQVLIRFERDGRAWSINNVDHLGVGVIARKVKPGEYSHIEYQSRKR